MKINSSILSFLVLLHLCGFAFAAMNKAWIDRSSGLTEGKVNCIYAGHSNGSFILAGTDKALYRYDNSRKTFQSVLQLNGNLKAIHQIGVDVHDMSTLYIATDAGVFVSFDAGATWKNIFAPAGAMARKVFCVLADSGAVYVGTADGLYIRHAGEVEWVKDTSELGKNLVFHLTGSGEFIYAATDKEIYRIEKSNSQLRKIYTTIGQHNEELLFSEEGEPIRKSMIKDLLSAGAGKELFAVIGREVLISDDQGENWDNWLTENLPVEFVRRLFFKGQLYAATEKGFFRYENGLWQNDVFGLTTQFINDVSVDEDGNIVLATLSGVYVKSDSSEKLAHIPYREIAQQFNVEPTIADVQKMAIDYANVNPKQIRSWHNQSRSKALLPSLSVGFNRADTELYHWDTGSNPDKLIKGQDYLDWNTTLSWDFSELVWSSDRTSIDSRSKLMSELRQDILDQVTRLYFERRRIQVELASMLEDDRDREMRIEELTAMIDGLTGGEFSRQTASAEKDSPVR